MTTNPGDDEVVADLVVEEVEGIVQCYRCTYWGTMAGYINQQDPKFINFVCPECNAAERVRNPECL